MILPCIAHSTRQRQRNSMPLRSYRYDACYCASSGAQVQCDMWMSKQAGCRASHENDIAALFTKLKPRCSSCR